MTTNLYIHEEVALLALRDREGTFISGSHCSYAIAGAILSDLLTARRIILEDGGNRIRTIDSTPLGEALLDECLAQIHEANAEDTPALVTKLASKKQLARRVAEGLCRRGVLRADEKKILLIFSRSVYPEVDPGPERELIERLRAAVFEDGEVAPRTRALLALADAGGLLRIPFDRKRLRARKSRIEALAGGDAVGLATRKAIQKAEDEAAMMVVITSAAT